MESPGSLGATEPRLFTGPFVALGIAELAYFTSAGMLILVTPLFARGRWAPIRSASGSRSAHSASQRSSFGRGAGASRIDGDGVRC
ncbi:MAG: hypothetical protein H0U86_04575 [Chloroflexi bacterium]|nr:hypothetical protein [Chloroflexota bacterium]